MSNPRGFRDILFAEAARREKLIRDISDYFASANYQLVETPSVEYPETLLCAQSGKPQTEANSLRDTFRFVDVDGNLIALRSDVTGALARVVATRFSLVDPPYRLRYVADVFREQESLRGSDRQMTQIGLECFGLSREQADVEVLRLSLDGLKAAGLNTCFVHIGDVRIIRSLLQMNDAGKEWFDAVTSAWSSGDFIAVKDMLNAGSLDAAIADTILQLMNLRGGREAINAAEELLKNYPEALQALNDLGTSYVALNDQYDDVGGLDDAKSQIIVDFSLTPHFDYYSGLIFELYAKTAEERAHIVGSGGRYDGLMQKFGAAMPAAGFVYDLSALERVVVSYSESSDTQPARTPLRIAVPKGKLYDDCVDLLRRADISTPGLDDPGRSLMLHDNDYQIIIAKPSDVAIYVSRGVADIGISGRDTLVEADFPLLQLADLRFGQCEFVVATSNDMKMSLEELSLAIGTIRVATKYPRLTQRYFDERGIQVEIVKLNGNIELAPLIGIADVVVDITQTGTTLRENNLRILDHVLPSTARFVAQYSAARTDKRVVKLVKQLEELL